MFTNEFYPRLSDILKLDSLPEELNLVKEEVSDLLSDIYYKNYYTYTNNSGVTVSKEITILILKALKFDIPGTGISLNINANYDPALGQYITEIPLKFECTLPIRKYLPAFKLTNFSNLGKDFVYIAENAYRINDIDFLLYAYTCFNQNLTFADFVDKINGFYQLSGSADEIPYPGSTDLRNKLLDTISNIQNNSFFLTNKISIKKMVFEVFVIDTSIDINTVNNLLALYAHSGERNIIDNLSKLFIPTISAGLSINPAIEFPRNILVPVKANGEVEANENIKAKLVCDPFIFNVSSKGNIGINSDLVVSFPITHPRAVLGGTGITIGITKAKIDLSRKKNIPEADADGRPSDFIGVFIAEAVVGFPTNWNHNNASSTGEIIATNLLIGTGGISGTLALEAKSGVTTAPLIDLKLGSNFNISLDAFSITFQQNSVVSSTIKGTLNIPGFKDSTNQPAKLNIDVFIGNNGDFNITASEDQGIDALEIPNVLKIRLKSLSIGQKNNRFYAAISGFVDIIAAVDGISISGLPKNIEVKKLLIWEDGKIEIEGGSLTLPKALAVKIGPVKLSLSAIHLGSQEQKHGSDLRKYNYFGFDGGVNVNPGGVNVQGNGIKFFYTTDNDDFGGEPSAHRFLRIESIKIDIRIPGTAKKDEDTTLMLKGMLSMKNADPPTQNANNTKADPGKEYIGSVMFRANKLKIAGSVGMRLSPDIPAFLIDAEIDFGDKGIMLGSTGMGLYGLRGLVGQKYGLDKQESEDWWEFYKRPDEGINIEKFKQKEGFSLGVGATLGTYSDNGKTFCAKVFLMLGLPDIFLIQGQATILAKQRIMLGDTNDPPFSALIAINKEGIRSTLGVKLNKPESGKIARIEGKIDMAYFFNNASGWYINLGKDSPDSERIRARICDLFDAYTYLMISARGIKFGAGAKYETSRGYFGGKVKLELGAALDIKASLSFKPVQLGGSIDLAGYARISVFKFRLGISAGAGLAADVSHPFVISGYLYLDVDLPKPFKDVHLEVEFSWVFDKTKDTAPLPIMNVTVADNPAKAVSMITEERFGLNYISSGSSSIPALGSWSSFSNYVVPLDSFIDIDMDFPVKNITDYDATNGTVKIYGEVDGSEHIVMVPPQRGILDQVKHTMKIEAVRIRYWDPGSSTWKIYHPYDVVPAIKLIGEAIAKANASSDPATYFKTLPVAYWQMGDPGKNSKLRIMARNMLSHFSEASKGLHKLEYMGYGPGVITCTKPLRKGFELEWLSELPATQAMSKRFGRKGFAYVSRHADADIVSRASGYSGYNTGLRVISGNTVSIFMPEPAVTVLPKLEADTGSTVYISYYELNTANTDSPSGLPELTYTLIKTDTVAAASLNAYTGYSDPAHKISRIDVSVNLGTALGSMGGGGVLPLNNANLLIGGDGNYNQPNCQAVTLDNMVIYYNHPLVAGPTANTIQYPYPLIASVNAIGHWQLNNNASDSSGNGYNGTYLNTPRPAIGSDGVPNNALTFCHSAIQVTHNNQLNLNGNQFLIGFWFNTGFTCMQPNKTFVVMEKKASGGALYRITGSYDIALGTESLLFELKEGYGTTNNLLQMKYNGPAVALSGTSVQLCDNNWHYVTIFCNKSSQTLKMYIDGQLINTTGTSVFNSLGTGIPLSDSAWIYSVEAINESTYNFNINIPSQSQLNTQNSKMTDAMTATVQPLWRPDTTYAIQVEVSDTVEDGSSVKTTSYHNFGFKTSGPVGHFHELRQEYNDLKAEDREDEFALASLKPYVNYERSYPNADGNLLNAKPLFYTSPKLKLFFNKPYVYNMFGTWQLDSLTAVETDIKLKVLDPEAQLSGADALQGQWVQKNNMVSTGEDERMLQNLAAFGPNCSAMPTTLTRINFSAEYQLPDLKPNKMYTAAYATTMKIGTADPVNSKVLQYVFNTSRYPDFAAQINSYTLYSSGSIVKKAQFDISRAWSSGDITTAIQTFTSPQSNPDALKIQYSDIYDRLISGVLKLTALETPQSTEVNVIKNTTTGKILGLLVRNPEPFFDPRINPASLGSGDKPVASSCSQTSPPATITSFVNLFNKDRSAVWIANTGLDMPLGDYTLTFKNLLWDGAQYAASGSPVSITFTL